MNRTLSNVLFSGFGSAAGGSKNKVEGEMKAISADDAYYILEAAQSVVFIPGYGMAVAQAQHVVKELAEILENNGAEVSFAIHPVAGRMPGHMNVLLAEADVPYEQLKEMEEANKILETADVAIVIGAIAAAIVIVNTALTAYNAVMAISAALTAAVTAPILAVVAAIAAVIAIIVLCIKYWDEIQAVVAKVVEAIKTAVPYERMDI